MSEEIFQFENIDFKDSDNNYKQEKAEKITSRSSNNQLEQVLGEKLHHRRIPINHAQRQSFCTKVQAPGMS